MHKTRKQDYYNDVIAECDVFFAIFYKKAGLTKEKLDIAITRFRQGGNPKYIYTYFYEPSISLDSLNSDYSGVLQLKEYLKSIGHVFVSVKSDRDLYFEVLREIDEVVQEVISRSISNVEDMTYEQKLQAYFSRPPEKPSSKGKPIVKLTSDNEDSRNIYILDQLYNSLLMKMEQDKLLLGYVKPEDVVEMARLEFDLNRIHNQG